MSKAGSSPFGTLVFLKASSIKRGMFQRPTDKARTVRIARAWDWRVFRPIVIARNGATDYCVDGQHTLAAMVWLVTNEPTKAKSLGIDLDAIPCHIIPVASYEEAASIYVTLNTEAKSLGAFDKWVGRKESGDKTVLECERIIYTHGLKVERNQGVVTISSVSAIEDIFGNGNLDGVLDIVTKAWDPSSYTNDAIKPRTEGAFLKAWSLYISRLKVIDKTPPVTADVVKRIQSRSIQSRWSGKAEPIVPRTLLSLADLLADEQYATGGRRQSSGNQHEDVFNAIGQALHGKKVWRSRYGGR